MTIDEIRQLSPALADVVEAAQKTKLLRVHIYPPEKKLVEVLDVLDATPYPADPHAEARAERRKVVERVKEIVAEAKITIIVLVIAVIGLSVMCLVDEHRWVYWQQVASGENRTIHEQAVAIQWFRDNLEFGFTVESETLMRIKGDSAWHTVYPGRISE